MKMKDKETVINYYEKFVSEVKSGKLIFALKGPNGFPVCESNENEEFKIMLFWGDVIKAKVFKNANYKDHEIVGITMEQYINQWMVGMKKDSMLVGPNWDKDGFGLEVAPDDVVKRLTQVQQKFL
jgi:hypothetical protein